MNSKNTRVKKVCKDVITKAAYGMAVVDANTSCPLAGYQPKEPKSMKKLRKF
ncbi:MAG: cyclic lactone autoinducer peptide [Lachnospiraceae bacterium]|nr:cyclic lactone autoinducer peptide [Lachnospiraceae bacterium]